MNPWAIRTDSFFDGEVLHDQGPYVLAIRGGRIAEINQGESASVDAHSFRQTTFLMPGLVEAHAHLFLDGATLDFAARSAYLKSSHENMLATARANVASSLACGVTLIRDAGDKFGINHAIRDEINDDNSGPRIRSAGLALNRRKNYGAFMARPVDDEADIRSAIAETAKTSDDLKIILTGIIDFDAGAVTAPVQFSVDDLTLMIDVARDHGLRTFAHCSGIEGIRNAVEAGIGSIEHGFFMDQPMLERMAEKDIAWVQTFSPVHFQWTHPEFAKWSPQTITNIRGIVDSHLEHAALAARLGTPLVAGSDAGSHGVVHGQGLIEELLFLIEAGIPMTEVLTSATSRPRRLWGAPSNRIAADANAEFITYSTSPFENSEALRNVESVVRDGRVLHESKNIELDKITA